ncbi:hypothetical protein [Salinarimonas ramus]|uniref:Uncharacterized protein n=1 Tax=Salinarimonas ramus TaxID=690164 RepID=A0A917V2T1_9HYPH|nr:hypothetical protein [Salinarimonas ramus]GGK25752.1 hypothetical protein GCM10011322_10360 [Salinarimonas ramus]
MRRLTFATALAVSTGLLAACSDAQAPDDLLDPARGDAAARIVPAEEALDGVHLPPLDPSTMTWAEIDVAIDAPTICVFRYTSTSRPVVATGFGADDRPMRAVVKLAGDLVLLDAQAGETAAAYRLAAGDVTVVVSPLAGEDALAEMTFAVGETLHAGYRGYHECAAPGS